MIHPYLEGNPKLDGNKSRLPLDVPSNHPNRYQLVYNHIWHMIQQLASLLVKYMLDKSQILDHIILTCELTQCRCNWFRLPLQGQVPDRSSPRSATLCWRCASSWHPTRPCDWCDTSWRTGPWTRRCVGNPLKNGGFHGKIMGNYGEIFEPLCRGS